MKNDGGPAFPVVGENGPYGEGDFITVGMSLRDYFAARAKESDIEYYKKYKGGDHERTIFARTREQAKYAYADAMLKAREE